MINKIKKVFKYINTLRYLKASQIFWRLFYKAHPTPKISIAKLIMLRSNDELGVWQVPIEKKIKMLGFRRFKFLNIEHEISKVADWNNPKWPKLWLYNLHYFDDLNCEKAHLRSQWHVDLMQKWINENPIGCGNGWEPYPISLRIVNWIKWVFAGNVLDTEQMDSLSLQVRFLIKRLEFHLLGNHLFANAKALIYSGLFFHGDEADFWLKRGESILCEQLDEQVLSDGGNFELSPMYHAIFLEDILDIINIYRRYNVKVNDKIISIATSMFRWLHIMTHPNGELSFFNDCANNISASMQELNFYGERLNLPVYIENNRKENKLTHLSKSGYCRVERNNMVAILDVASVGPDYIPGHGHADSFSFECSLFGEKVIVNSGTSVYGGSVERIRQRGTKAHSTLMIDDENSSEVWQGFRVARRAKVFDLKIGHNNGIDTVSASHNGYYRLSGKPKHTREWKFNDENIDVIDVVHGKGEHKIDILYHLHPDIIIKSIVGNKILLQNKLKYFTLELYGDGKLIVEDSTYHPEFGISLENKVIVLKKQRCLLPFKMKARLSW